MTIYSPIIVLCFFLFVGCIPPPKGDTDIYTNYEVGIPRVVAIGDDLIKVTSGTFLTTPVYEAIDTATISYRSSFNLLKNSFFQINKGDKFLVTPTIGEKAFLRSFNKTKSFINILISKQGKLLNLSDGYGEVSFLNINNDTILFKKSEPVKTLINNGFSYEIIVTEISDSHIRGIYREYFNDLIRNYFSYPVTFDISKNSIIHFKSISIKVLNIGNNSMEYVVLTE